jgi:xanthine phosphoribosyltransferase
MRLLEERILRDGKLGEGNVLKVDSFLNHQMDVAFLNQLGEAFYQLFQDCGVTKILTIESSGIGIAALTAQYFKVPMVFAKKTKTKNIYGDVYTSKVESFTHGTTYDIIVSKEFLSPGDRVLLIDDFLAKGNALIGLLDLVEAAGAITVGAGIVIEKAFQEGGERIRSRGIRVESLARIAEMDVKTGIRFCPDASQD